jgi:hypothetical protein
MCDQQFDLFRGSQLAAATKLPISWAEAYRPSPVETSSTGSPAITSRSATVICRVGAMSFLAECRRSAAG